MPVNKERLESILRRFQALEQRAAELRQVIHLLAQGVTFRTQDGSLAIELSQEDKQNIKTWLTGYLDECQAILDSIRVEVS